MIFIYFFEFLFDFIIHIFPSQILSAPGAHLLSVFTYELEGSHQETEFTFSLKVCTIHMYNIYIQNTSTCIHITCAYTIKYRHLYTNTSTHVIQHTSSITRHPSHVITHTCNFLFSKEINGGFVFF